MCRPATFSLEKDTVMLSYSDNVANYCTPFSWEIVTSMTFSRKMPSYMIENTSAALMHG